MQIALPSLRMPTETKSELLAWINLISICANNFCFSSRPSVTCTCTILQRHFYPRVKLMKRLIIQSSKQAEQIIFNTFKPTLATRNNLLDHVFTWDPRADHPESRVQRTPGQYLAEHEGRWTNFQEMPVQTSDNNAFAEKNTNWSVKTVLVPRSKNWGRAKGNSEEEARSIPISNFVLPQDDISAKEAKMQQSPVTTSTIHVTKGLERSVVFISLAYQGSTPHSKAEDKNGQRRF